jgi:hypothetical protein
MLNKAQELWDLNDDEFEVVAIPEWKIGGEVVSVRLRGLSGAERDRYEASCTRMVKGQPVPDPVNARARIVAWAAVNEEGEHIFKGQEDVLKLGMKNAKAVNRLWEHACRLSGIDFDGTQAEADEADFTDAQSGNSTSG